MTYWLFWAGIDCFLFGFSWQLIPKQKIVNKVRRQFLSSTRVKYDMKETQILDFFKKFRHLLWPSPHMFQKYSIYAYLILLLVQKCLTTFKIVWSCFFFIWTQSNFSFILPYITCASRTKNEITNSLINEFKVLQNDLKPLKKVRLKMFLRNK